MDEFWMQGSVHLRGVDAVVGGGGVGGGGGEGGGCRRVLGVGEMAGGRGLRGWGWPDWDLLKRRGSLLNWSLRGSEKKVSLNLCVSLIIHHDDNPLSLWLPSPMPSWWSAPPGRRRPSASSHAFERLEDNSQAGQRPLKILVFKLRQIFGSKTPNTSW